MKLKEHDERRKTPRIPTAKACKLFMRGTWKYVPAHTINVSERGVLVELADGAAGAVGVGDAVDVAISWSGGVVLRSDEFTHGRVVRTDTGGNGRTRAAVVLSRAIDTPLAA